MNDLRTAYEKLYNSIAGSQWEEGFCKEGLLAEYTTFTAMQGHRYSDSTNNKGEDLRFMLVGRAINGWDEFRVDSSKYMTKEAFVNSSIANIVNSRETVIFGKDRFEWIDTSGATPCNTARVGIDREEVHGRYSLKRAQIWSYTKAIWDTLFGEVTLWSDRWFENIVWSNLYKVSPHNEGNPSGDLQSQERKACIDLLKAEIEYFRPTHIFFATQRDHWFSYFTEIFAHVQSFDTNVFSGDRKNEEYVEAIGTYLYPDGESAKVVVACRPEGRTKDKYVKQVSDYLM